MMTTQAKSSGWLVLGALLTLAGCEPSLAPEVYLVPAHYEGVLIVQYSQADCPPLPRAGDSLVFDFRPGHVLRTSSPLMTGTGASDSFQYYYVDAQGRRTRIRKVADWQALRMRPPHEPCLVVNAGQTSQNLTSKFLTSAQDFERNDTLGTRLFDSLLAKDTLSVPLQ
ncbi:MAG: hypothetical protein EOO56_01580 [Hymenobacter sp.]|nr:MAG: hypothetical protein EOO56_01580 [Hymenobacter sp.]